MPILSSCRYDNHSTVMCKAACAVLGLEVFWRGVQLCSPAALGVGLSSTQRCRRYFQVEGGGS